MVLTVLILTTAELHFLEREVKSWGTILADWPQPKAFDGAIGMQTITKADTISIVVRKAHLPRILIKHFMFVNFIVYLLV
jgi:hypothetical protein